MRVVVFGATGPTGSLIVRDALAAGYDVTAVARTPAKVTLKDTRLAVVQGDALDAASVRKAVAGHDAVASALGANFGFKPVQIYSEGARNILAAMAATGVRRFVGITSGGTYTGIKPKRSFVFELTIGRLLANLYNDQRRMEELVAASDTDWTILRPPRLTKGARTGRVRRSVDAYILSYGDSLSREDLAAEVVHQLGPDGDLRAAVGIATQSL